MSNRRTGVIATCFAAILLAPLLHAGGDKSDTRVYPVDEKVAGKTYSEWTAAWWQWACAIKKDRNPVLDQTGAFAAEGQTHPVWFLAGNIGGKTTRKCTVPAGKPILVAVLNYCETAPPEKADEKKLISLPKAEIDRAIDLEVTLDRKTITGLKQFRVASGLFMLTGPDAAADAAFADAVGKQKAASDGYWLMLRPLPPGRHTLHFKGKVPHEKGLDAFALDVTYQLTVEEKK